MKLKKILDQIPNYKNFMTISELDNSSKRLADLNKSVELNVVGTSREGRNIYCLKIGEGRNNVLLFGFPHPNEPMGSMTLEFLSHFLVNNPNFYKEMDLTWYLIKAIDIDGAILNEGWFKGKFDPIKYANNFFRPASFDQIEWSFPIKYKKLNFNFSPPETEALMRLIKEIKPKLMCSLHNSAFGGIYYYVSYEVGNLFNDLITFVKEEKLPLHLGESEAPYIKKLYDAIFENFGVQKSYDYLEVRGIENPQEFITAGTTSFDYLKSITGENSFALTCEIPYFYHKSIEDNSTTELNRRPLYIESLEYMKMIYKYSRKIFNHIKKLCSKSSRMFIAVDDYFRRARPELEFSINNAKSSSDYDGKATVAQVFDYKISSRYYCLLTVSMITRLCDEAVSNHLEVEDSIAKIKKDFKDWIETKIRELLKKIKFKVIPIQKLVRVQVGSTFITLENLAKTLEKN
jgi:hypothetical protein